ncbi:MAG: hypothetical protein ACLFQU_12815 [Candidatus Kapaibacterium sp.]
MRKKIINKIKKTGMALVISVLLAAAQAQGRSTINKRPPSIVYRFDKIPVYGRRRPLKKHFRWELNAK